MVKFTFCLRRLPHLSRQEFQQYWRETHTPLVRQHAALLRIRRYVQSYTLSVAENEAIRQRWGTEEPYDGVVEVWWNHLGELTEALHTPEGRQAHRELQEDERRFIDLTRSCAWFVEEVTVVDV